MAVSKKQGGVHSEPQQLSLSERLQALRNLPSFFHLIWECSPVLSAMNAGLRSLRALLPLGMLYLGKLIIDEVVFLTSASEPDFERVGILVLIELGLAASTDLIGRGIAVADSLLGDLVSHDISLRLMDHATKLDIAHFEDAEFYDKLERARRQASNRILLMSQSLNQIQDLMTVVTLSLALIAFNPWLLMLLAVALIPAFLGETHFTGQSYSLMYGWTEERRELDYLRYAGASDETAKEVKIFGLADFLKDRYRKLAWDYYSANRSLTLRRAAWGGGLSLLGSIGYYTAFAVIIFQTVHGQLSLGDLTFLSGSFLRMRTLMESVLNRFSSIAESALHLRDLFDFFSLQPDIRSKSGALPFPKPVREGFVFENVSFHYPNSDQSVLRNVSFRLGPQEKLALVGENGAGKTTLVKLLTRLHDPSKGRILLDGRDLRDYDLKELRHAVGVIFQDFVRYHLTASENIAVGRIEAMDDHERIAESARRSLADRVIERLPEGYEQRIGRWFRKGTNLSGGEWQKIALARAYMRDAELLILDEPTAALDARAEHQIFNRFVELTEGKCAVLISHRFSTVRMADRILVLHEGTLLEDGPHEELLKQGGQYAELFSLQASGYL
ncbi:MAG: ABC transporter ATP-binding protein [SAR324 cluster bacterium]|nr:ABC transporter ATP-binding protein [SAR324 cluster bacterium]MEE1576448.1 ABC transporter ATP-binding protein [Deltaproteobacteria bacterium]MDP6246299.1 ABC transporter ATP-binding protein [SAR324 cluster bacterium]MDP6462976.1 ABC transporter ATP-binding protein [SAR324 cluster bacterium]MDP7136955.1 ABC transporter ATP-binding protein [SAR324 cluster bacterium]